MIVSRIMLIALVGLLAACGAIETASISQMSIEEKIALRDKHMRAISDRDLEKLMRNEHVHPSIALLPNYRASAMKEYQRRTGIPMSQLKTASEGKIFIGMDIRAALFAWDCNRAGNVSAGSWGRHTQYVCDGSYIYTRNSNRVSSYQT